MPRPSLIRYGGYLYEKVVKVVSATFDADVQAISSGIETAVMAFDQFMQLQQEGDVAKALPQLIKVFDGTYGAAQACQRIFQQVVPEQREASPQKVRYNGRIYTAVEHPSEPMGADSAAREYEVGVAHLTAIMKDAATVATRARDLLQALKGVKLEAEQALTKHPDKLDVGQVAALNPQYRVEHFKDPIRSMEKANRSLNYTVDAACTAIGVVLDQIDAMVDEWHARVESMNAPHPSKDLTNPILMSDNPAEVFDELGGM